MVEQERQLRIAAVGDIHFDGTRTGELRDLFSDVHRNADVLALCGDLTTHGRPDQMRAFVEELAGVEVPIVAVLGNHDFENDQEEACTEVLESAGVQVLDGTSTIIEGVGFAGTKGFAGGFGRGALGPFGESLIKDFVNAAVDEALKLERALQHLRAESRIVLLHYAPIVDTVFGEPEVIYPFLGSSRLLQPIDTLGANVVFHGHAHLARTGSRDARGYPGIQRLAPAAPHARYELPDRQRAGAGPAWRRGTRPDSGSAVSRIAPGTG
jgi:Icc-related predicted phosphoesterase